MLSLAALNTAYAGSAAWNVNPIDNNWNNPANWTPPTVPEQIGDIATFGPSSITSVSFSAGVTVSGIVFQPNASAYTITVSGHNETVYFMGEPAGAIINRSGKVQKFLGLATVCSAHCLGDAFQFQRVSLDPLLDFTAAASNIRFVDQVGPVSANFTINAARSADSAPGSLVFTSLGGNTDAGDSTITLEGASVDGAQGGQAVFGASSGFGSAGNAVITANGGTTTGAFGGSVIFALGGSAKNATLIANGGTNGGEGGLIFFETAAAADTTARIELFGNAILNTFGEYFVPFKIGSLEGSGTVSLGSTALVTGRNNLNTTFSGIIKDGGSLTKVGIGALTLEGANTYTGGTKINEGTLIVGNSAGSATGTGLVLVNGGTLGGSGTIAGAVVIGTGDGPGAFLAPGTAGSLPTIFTTQDRLSFKADGTYTYELDTNTAEGDQVVANRIRIESGAQFEFEVIGNQKLDLGQVFTPINNVSTNRIRGTFTNLPHGSIVAINGNNLQVSYEGGDGNDLTLTVVP
jgi:autotransporter-associated beta strand protein